MSLDAEFHGQSGDIVNKENDTPRPELKKPLGEAALAEASSYASLPVLESTPELDAMIRESLGGRKDKLTKPPNKNPSTSHTRRHGRSKFYK